MKIRTQPSHCPRRGAALVLSLLFVLTVGALSLSLSSVQSTMERSHRFSQDRRAALYIAESGMAEASLALSQGKSGVIGSEETPAEFGQGLYWVETEDQADGSSILRCTAQVRSAEFVVKTTVLPNLNPVTSRGFFGLEGVELGQGTLIDGYDSTDGSYESQVTEVDPHRTTGLIGRLGTLKQVRFSAGSSSSQASSSSSSSEVAWGELLEQAGGEGEEAAQSSMSSGDSTEAESSVSANLPTTVLADIDGFVVASGTPVLGGDINPEPTGFLPPPTIRPGTAAEALGDVSILGTHTGLPQGESVGIEGDLILRPGATLRLNGPLILAARSLQLMSGAELLLDDTNGPILVFLEQGMDCAEDTRMESLAAEPEARGTSIVVAAPGDTPRPDLSLPSEGRFHGSLYAPGDRVEVPATLRWLGALTARRLTTAPGARLSFDVRLAVGSQAISTTPRITSWRIMPVGDGLARLLALDPRHALRLRGVTPVPSGSAAPESACEALFVSSTGAAETYSGHFSGLDLSSKRLLEIRWEDPRSQELRGWTRPAGSDPDRTIAAYREKAIQIRETLREEGREANLLGKAALAGVARNLSVDRLIEAVELRPLASSNGPPVSEGDDPSDGHGDDFFERSDGDAGETSPTDSDTTEAGTTVPEAAGADGPGDPLSSSQGTSSPSVEDALEDLANAILALLLYVFFGC